MSIWQTSQVQELLSGLWDRHLQKWYQGRKSGDSRFRSVRWGCQRSSEATVISGGRKENWANPVRYIVYVGFEQPDPSFHGGMGSALMLPAYTIGMFFG